MLGTVLTGCAVLAVVIALHSIRPLPYVPRDGIHLFLYPLFITALAGWLLSASRARALLLCLFGALLLWVVGITPVMVTLLLLLDALVVGEFTWKRLGFDSGEAGLLHAVLMIPLGLAEIGLVLTGLLHFYLVDGAVYGAAMVLIALLGHKRVADHARALWRWFRDDGHVGLAVWIASGGLLGAILLNVATSTFFGGEIDTLGVYMYVPSYIATFGGWSYDYHKYVWAVMPNLLEMLDSIPYVLSDPVGTQFFNAALAVLTGMFIYAFCRPRTGSFNALLCAIGWLSLPVVIQEAASLHDDIVLALFLFAALVCLHEARVQAGKPWAAGLVTGLLVSAAVATKLMGWILCPVYLLVVVVWFTRKRGAAWAVQAAVAAMVTVLVLGGFQYWYAWMTTGNPVFPFYNGIFQSPYYEPRNFLDHSSVGHFDWQLPFSLTFHTDRFGGIGAGGVGFQWLMLLPAALLFSLPGGGNQRRWFGFAGLWFGFFVMMPEQFARYLIPTFPFLSVFIGEAGAQAGRRMQLAFKSAFILAIGINVYAVQAVFYNTKDIVTETVFSQQKRAEFERAVVPIVALNKIINQLESEPVNVLDVSKGEGAGLRGTALYLSWESPEVSASFGKALDSNNFAAFMGKYHVSYVIMDMAFGKQNQAPPPALYDFCQKHAERITQVGSAVLYRLDPLITYSSRALVNPGLSDDAKGWSRYKFTKPVPAPGGGYLLENNQALMQGIRPGVLASGRRYSLDVTVSCLNQQGWVYPQIVWSVGKEHRQVGDGMLYFCSQKGPLNVHGVYTAPADVVGGYVSVSANAGAQAAVQGIFLSY